jgi:hypothetical protein
MSFSERITTGKPYAWGFVLGLIAAPIIAFSAGWVATSGAQAVAVENARIETLAGVCSEAAQRLWASESMDLAALTGWDNRAAREELVARTLANIQVPEDLASRVSRECGQSFA